MMNERYARHISLSEVGPAGQTKFSQAKVLVVGAGGLGCPVLQYLAAAGVGTIGIVDFDKVSLSNLQRQILYKENDIGKNKALIAKEHLESLNSQIAIYAYPVLLDIKNCLEILPAYDLIVDGTDNFQTRYLINDLCCKLNKPMVYGSLYKFEGQVSVFNYKNGPSYRCLFPDPPKLGEVPNCNEIGILGVLPGQVGLLQATEVLKIILGVGEILSGKMLYINVLNHSQRIIAFNKNEKIIREIKNTDLQLIDINDCYVSQEISLSDIDIEEKNLWVDVRELEEEPQVDIKGLRRIPFSRLLSELQSISNSQKKILFCQSGVRAREAAQVLIKNNISEVYVLKEGAHALHSYLK